MAGKELPPAQALDTIHKYMTGHVKPPSRDMITNILALEEEAQQKPKVGNYLRGVGSIYFPDLVDEIAFTSAALSRLPEDQEVRTELEDQLRAADVLSLGLNDKLRYFLDKIRVEHHLMPIPGAPEDHLDEQPEVKLGGFSPKPISGTLVNPAMSTDAPVVKYGPTKSGVGDVKPVDSDEGKGTPEQSQGGLDEDSQALTIAGILKKFMRSLQAGEKIEVGDNSNLAQQLQRVKPLLGKKEWGDLIGGLLSYASLPKNQRLVDSLELAELLDRIEKGLRPDSAGPVGSEKGEANKTPEALVGEWWQELREAMWQSDLELERTDVGRPPSEQEIAASERIAQALTRMELSEAAPLFRTYPFRFRNSVMPVLVRLYPDRAAVLQGVLHQLEKQAFSQSLGGYESFEKVVADLRNFRREHEDEIFNRPATEATREHSRLMDIVMKLADRVNLESADPAILEDIPDAAKYTVFSVIREMGTSAPQRWQQAMEGWTRRYSTRVDEIIDRHLLTDRVNDFNDLIYAPFSEQNEQRRNELRTDIAEGLEKIPAHALKEELHLIFGNDRFPLDVSLRLMDEVIGAGSTWPLNNEIAAAIESARIEIINAQRARDLYQEQRARFEEANTPEAIIPLMKTVSSLARREGVSRDAHMRYEFITRQLGIQLDEAWNLPAEERIVAAEAEERRENNIHFVDFILSQTLINQQQRELFTRLYSKAPQSLQQLLASFLDSNAKQSVGTSTDRGQAFTTAREFYSLHKQTALLDTGIVDTEEESSQKDAAKKRLGALLQDQESGIEEFKNAWVECNRTRVRWLQKYAKIKQAIHDYDEKMARETGLIIEYQGYNTPRLSIAS